MINEHIVQLESTTKAQNYTQGGTRNEAIAGAIIGDQRNNAFTGAVLGGATGPTVDKSKDAQD